MAKRGYLVVWEAFTSKTYRQMKLIEENVPGMFDSHSTVSIMIREGEFVDGTHILKEPLRPEDISFSQTSLTESEVYTPDLNALPLSWIQQFL